MPGMRTGTTFRRPLLRANRNAPRLPSKPRYVRTPNYTKVTKATSDLSTVSESVSIKVSITEPMVFSEIGGRAQQQKASASITTLNTAMVTQLLPVANDERTTAIDLATVSLFTGQVNFDNTTATNNAADPTFIHAGFNSMFYRWTPAQNGTVTFQTGPENLDGNTTPYIDTRIGAYTYSGSYTIIAENDDSADDPNGKSSLISFTATAGTTYYIVISSSSSTLYTNVSGLAPYGIGPGYLAWSFSVTDTVIHDEQIVLSPTTIVSTPAVLNITVSQVNPGATITATIGITTIGTAVVDDTGIAFLTPTVSNLSAGPYTITLTQNSPAETGTVQLIVEQTSSSDSFVADAGYPGHSAQKWRFYDPITTAMYDFEVNPDTWETPVFERTLSSLVTTSLQGQALVFEGNQRPISWNWSGWIETQTQYDAFVTWYNKRYRVVLYDSLGRTVVLYIAAFNPQPQIKNDPNPYLMRYTMTALVYSVV